MTGLVDNIRSSLVGLKMPRALEALDHTLQRLEKGEIGALEAIDGLLGEEFILREGRRIGMALMTAKLTPPKTLESFDFTFQPSLDRDRIMALAQLEFIPRAEVVHFLGPPGTGKSHLASALGVAAVRAGKSVYRSTLAELIEARSKAEREGRLADKIRFYARTSLLIVHCPAGKRSAAERGRNRLPADHARWGQSVLPTRQCPL
jgi:DNA replication protein DnaC